MDAIMNISDYMFTVYNATSIHDKINIRATGNQDTSLNWMPYNDDVLELFFFNH